MWRKAANQSDSKVEEYKSFMIHDDSVHLGFYAFLATYFCGLALL